MPSVYTPFDPTKPVGSDTGPNAIGSANTNDVALALAIVHGQEPGWVLAATTGTGTAEQPQFYFWTRSGSPIRVLRATNTWGSSGGSTGNLTQQVIDYSTDNGVTYANVCTATWSYDSSGNIVSSTGAGGMMAVVYYLFGKVKSVLSSLTTHMASTTAHSILGMAQQAPTAVAITGGTIKTTTIGTATPSDCALATGLSVREIHSAVTFVTTTMNLDLSTAGSFSFTATGTGAQALTFTNPAGSGVSHSFVVEITNGGLRTWTWPTGTKWPSGTPPTLSSAGKDVISFWTRDGGSTWNASLYGKAFA